MNAVVASKSTNQTGSAVLPDWRSLFHPDYDPAFAVRFTAKQRVEQIGVPNALRVKLALLARLNGRQDQTYAAILRRSVLTESPIRQGIVVNCLMHEADRLGELTNVRGNNFRDQISKALLEAGDLDCFEHPGRKGSESPLLTRTIPVIVRARIGAIPLSEIRKWLMNGREISVGNYFYRVLLHLAHERRDSEPKVAGEILSGAASSIFYPSHKESSKERLSHLQVLNPAVLELAVQNLESPDASRLPSDISEIRRALGSRGAVQVADWLKKVPTLQSLANL